MFVLQGKLLNIFETPKGKSKDGENYGGDDKIQILSEKCELSFSDFAFSLPIFGRKKRTIT